MKTSVLDCLAHAARSILAPWGVSRIALLGALEPDPHLLVEFGAGAPAMMLDDWLRFQRQLRERCHPRVELVSVTRLEEHVAADSVALTVLYDSAATGRAPRG